MLQSVTEYNRVLESVTECYRVLQSVTEYYRVLQCITKYYKANLAHLLGPIFGLVSKRAQKTIFEHLMCFCPQFLSHETCLFDVISEGPEKN